MKDEQITLDGIPIPLTLETLLDAMEKASRELLIVSRYRQYRAFRERILEEHETRLRVDASAQMSPLWKRVAKKWFDRGEIAEGQVILCEIALAAKDTRIAELERKLDLERRINLPEGEDD